MTWAAVAVVIAALAGQAFWIGHALTGLREDVRDLRRDVERVEAHVLRDLGERVARLEERTGA